MVYQDMFRVRPYPDQGGRIMHCMHRVGGFRFNRSLTQANLRGFSATAISWDGKLDHQSMLLALAFRAIHFHDLIKSYQGSDITKVDLKGKEVVPLQACIHKANNRANRPRPEVFRLKKKEEKKQEEAKGMSEDVSSTPEVQSAKGTPHALTISSGLG